jgi:outer membrane protein assembly factor BamA
MIFLENRRFFLWLALLFQGFVFAQVADSIKTTDSLKVKKNTQKWAFIGAPVFSGETNWRLGVVASRAFAASQEGDKPSDLDMSFEYSLRNQFRFGLTPNFFTAGNVWHFRAEIDGIQWPTDFFGVGTNRSAKNTTAADSSTYDAMGLRSRWTAERSFYDHKIWAGFRVLGNFENIEFHSDTIKNRFDSLGVLGLEGYRSVGIGFISSYDTRNHINWPTTGTLVSAEARIHPKWLGSSQSYNLGDFSLSQFFPAPFGSALALNVLYRANTGDVPFREMAMPNGSHQLRGLKNGRYRDKQMASSGVEWRVPSPFSGFFGRFGLTTFAEQAQVAQNIDSFNSSNWISAYGLGLRFALNPERKYNARIDIANVDKHVALLISVREAF